MNYDLSFSPTYTWDVNTIIRFYTSVRNIYLYETTHPTDLLTQSFCLSNTKLIQVHRKEYCFLPGNIIHRGNDSHTAFDDEYIDDSRASYRGGTFLQNPFPRAHRENRKRGWEKNRETKVRGTRCTSICE